MFIEIVNNSRSYLMMLIKLYAWLGLTRLRRNLNYAINCCFCSTLERFNVRFGCKSDNKSPTSRFYDFMRVFCLPISKNYRKLFQSITLNCRGLYFSLLISMKSCKSWPSLMLFGNCLVSRLIMEEKRDNSLFWNQQLADKNLLISESGWWHRHNYTEKSVV